MQRIALSQHGWHGPGASDAIRAMEDRLIALTGGGCEVQDAHSLLLWAEGSDGVLSAGNNGAFGVDALALAVNGFEGDGGLKAGDEIAAFREEVKGIGIDRILVEQSYGIDAFDAIDNGDRLGEERFRREILHPVGICPELID